jgi:hypothetical protein
MLSATHDRPKSGSSIWIDSRVCLEQLWGWRRIRTSVLLAAEGEIMHVLLGVTYCSIMFICSGITLSVLNLNYINITCTESRFSWISMFGISNFHDRPFQYNFFRPFVTVSNKSEGGNVTSQPTSHTLLLLSKSLSAQANSFTKWGWVLSPFMERDSPSII